MGQGGQGPPSFQKTKSFLWQSALRLREKCCSDCIFDSRMLQSNICESLWLLECGAVKQWEMTSLLPAHSLAANRAFQNQKSGWKIWKCFNYLRHFDLISSVSWPQQPLICDCIYFSFPNLSPPPIGNISEKNFLGALFIQKVPLETGATQLFLCFLCPCIR